MSVDHQMIIWKLILLLVVLLHHQTQTKEIYYEMILMMRFVARAPSVPKKNNTFY